ncbi:MAG: hypothetical protein K2G44_06350 [Clostridia bacterium]|nr:hypothetical protein [Clostridia bacterium]
MEVVIIISLLSSIICFVVHGSMYKQFSISSVPFWIGIALLALFVVMCFVRWFWKKHKNKLQARRYFPELQKEYTKYVAIDFPLNINALKPSKRQLTLTMYREVDEQLLLESYKCFFNMDTKEVENARIGEFNATLQEVLSIRGKTILLLEGIYEEEKLNPVFTELFRNNRIITYDCED